MAQINLKDKKYLIKIVKAGIFQFWVLLLSLIVSILMLQDRFALLFLVILTISNLKGMLLIFNGKLSGKELVKALKPNRSIQLPEPDLSTAIEQVRLNLTTEQDEYFLVIMPGVAIFHQERPFILSLLRPNRFYCLETNEKGTKLSTFANEIPVLFKTFKAELAVI